MVPPPSCEAPSYAAARARPHSGMCTARHDLNEWEEVVPRLIDEAGVEYAASQHVLEHLDRGKVRGPPKLPLRARQGGGCT